MSHHRPSTETSKSDASAPLALPTTEPTQPNFSEAIAEMSGKFGEIAGNTALTLGKAAIDTAVGVGGVMSQTALQTSKAVVDVAAGVGGAVAQTTAQTGKTAVETAAAVGEVLSHTTVQTGRAIVETATWMGDVALWVGTASAKQAYHWVEQATQGTGQAVTLVSNNAVARRVSGVLKLDWLMGISDRVDLEKAQAAVRELQQKHPNEAPSQIAHRIMVEKAVYAGGVGLVSSLVPGAALALLAVDLAATATIQTEMVYQIAAAYGMELSDPTRKGEVLAIFGLALGGSKALKAGLEFLRVVPVAGAMIGAGTNATMLYTLGYAACRFYEAKQTTSAETATAKPAVADLETLKQESDKYLEVAIAQQAVMDQILVHMVLASYPEKTWETILPDLQRLQISETSLESIASNIKAPQPLGALLNQLNRDFAVPLLAQCLRVSQHSQHSISAQEQPVLQAIAEKFGLDLAAIEQELATGKALTEIIQPLELEQS